MFNVFKRSKICLNFTSSDVSLSVQHEEPWRRYIKQVKGRPFEICSCEAFCLTESTPGIERYFTPGVDLITFNSKESLLIEVKKYLRDDQSRKKIALSGAKKAIFWNSDENMLSAISSLSNKIKLNRNPLLKEEIFKSHQYKLKEVYYAIIFMMRFIRIGKIKYARDIFLYFQAYRIFNPLYFIQISQLILGRYVNIK